MDGHDPEMGSFSRLADVEPFGIVLFSTNKGVFSLEPDLTLKLISLPSEMRNLDVRSFAYAQAWRLAFFFDQNGIWSMDHDKVFNLIVRDEPILGWAKLTALPSGAGVYVTHAKQGDAVLIHEPVAPDGRCLFRDTRKG